MMPIKYQDAKTTLKQLIAELHLPSVQAGVLEVIAVDDYGFQLSAAPSILGASLNRSVDECSEVLTELMGANLLLKVGDESQSRIVANYAKLGASEELRQALRHGHYTAPY